MTRADAYDTHELMNVFPAISWCLSRGFGQFKDFADSLCDYHG